MTTKAKPEKPPRPRGDGRVARARKKIDDLPGLIPHRQVAMHFGVTPVALRDWVGRGVFPEPHSVFEHTWLYRVDHIRAFLESGTWPEGAKFRRYAKREEGAEGG